MYVVFLDDSLEKLNILNDNVLASLKVLRNWKTGGQNGYQIEVYSDITLYIKFCVLFSKLLELLIDLKFLFNRFVHACIMTSIVDIFQFCVTGTYTCTVKA